VNELISDYDNITALHYASTKSEYAVLELLKSGASLGIRNKENEMAIQFIESSTLRKFLDSCITKCVPEERSDCYFMTIDYSFLRAKKEMPPIAYMTEANDLKPLIEHPVIASFLFLKWLRMSHIFYLNLLLFSMNAIAFSIYLTMFYVKHDQPDSINHKWFPLLQGLAYLSFIMFSLKEILQFILSPTSYIKSIENYFEFGVTCLMAATLFTSHEDQKTRRSIAAALFLGFAVEWTLMLSALPIFSVSNYVVMLKKVAFNFLRTLAFYSIILLAFILSFHTLTNETTRIGNSTKIESNGTEDWQKKHPTFSNLFSTFFHVILMLTGDYEKTSGKVEDFVAGRIFLMVFVLSMSIVLMNLLVGLTVSDTAAIEREAESYKWSERAILLEKYECMALNL
jgi:transient receptor potential cation channel subfamily A member 1